MRTRLTPWVMVVVALGVWMQPVSGAPAKPRNKAEVSAFAETAAALYAELARFAEAKAQNPALAAHFRSREALARAGKQVDPEALRDWELDAEFQAEAVRARAVLVRQLESGAKARSPLLAALAQAHFDCWVAPFPDALVVGGTDCRERFYEVMSALAPGWLGLLNPNPPQAGVAAVSDVNAVSRQERPVPIIRIRPLATAPAAEKAPAS